MTLDRYPKSWRRMVKLFLLYCELPDNQAEQLIESLSLSDQKLFDIFVVTLQGPQKTLKRLESLWEKGHDELSSQIIEKLPRTALEELAKTGLKARKKELTDLIATIDIEELKNVVYLSSLPKSVLIFLLFWNDLDKEQHEYLEKGDN